MTDLELLNLAAKAAGIDLLERPEVHSHGAGLMAKHGHWSPLTDDGDALRLAVKLGMCIGPNFDNDRVVVDAGEFSSIHVVEMFATDKYAESRRAIVRAAAEIAKSK